MTFPRMLLGFIALTAMPPGVPQTLACPFCDALAQLNGAVAGGDSAEKHETETRREKESMAANRIRELQVELAELETHYSSRHPKVLALRQELQLLQAYEREAAAADLKSSPKLTVRRLQHANAAEVAIALEKLFRGETVRIAADSRANAILIRGSEKLREQILDLVESLDRESSEAVGKAEGGNAFSRTIRGAGQERGINDANAEFWGLDWERIKGLDIEGMRQLYQSMEEDAAKAASDYRKLPNGKTAPDVIKRLETSVQRAFAARQRLQAMEVEQYRKRLSQIEARIRRREVLKDRIISKRVEEFLNPELRWNDRSPGSPGRSDQAARSSTDNGASGSVSAMEQTRRGVSESEFTKNDTSEIQGRWRLERIIVPHRAHISFDGAREAIIANDTWTSVTNGELSTDSRLVVADPTSDPKTITFIRRSKRDGTPITTRGIYLVKSDTLEIFTSANGSQELVKSYDDERTVRQIWKRIAPARKETTGATKTHIPERGSNLVGRWKVVRLGSMAQNLLEGATAIFDQKSFYIHVPSQEDPHPRYVYTLKSDGIDFQDAEKNKAREIYLGKYLVKDNRLWLAMNDSYEQSTRPVDVTGQVPQEGILYAEFERIEPDDSGPRTPSPASTDKPVDFRELIAGRWVLVSADKDGKTFKLESTDIRDPFAAQEDDGKTFGSLDRFREFASAVFDHDHVSFGPHWNQSGQQWKYALEEETDPRRITLTEGDKTSNGIIWAWKRQMVISLAEEGGDSPKDFDSKGNGNIVLRYERDETDPQWLRSEVAHLREIATNLLLHGNEVQQKTAREFMDMADSMAREAKLREQAYSAKSRANELRKTGKLQQAKSLENQAAQPSAHADQERAMRIADQRIRQQEERFREKIKQLNFRAGALRNEGRFDAADEIDREVQQLLRDRDPDLKRANELKQRAAGARLEGKHRDAELYDQQADELLRVIRQRYKSVDLPRESGNQNLEQADGTLE